MDKGSGRAVGVDSADLPDVSAFFDVSLDMLCIRDLDGRFVKLNGAWEDVLGYPVEVLEGEALLPLIHPEDVESTRAHMRRLDIDEPNGEVVGFVNRYRHLDGHYRHLEWRARRSGERVYAVARDVTERLALEAEMAAARQAAEDANRAKSEFLANMSHEIRTPLNGVIGVTAVLRQSALAPEHREMVELIERSGVTLERLVSDILDVSKIESGQMDIEISELDLDREIGGVVDLMRIRAESRDLAFRVAQGPAAHGEFLGDSTRLKQVLVNLLSNAVKFTERGEVSLTIDVVDDHPEPGVSTLTVVVADTGVGFDAAFADSLFDRFSQADGSITRRFGGSGLGLSICRSLVELMGGTISARSTPGVGSRFEIAVPLSRTRALADYSRPDVHAPVGDISLMLPSTDGSGLRVLLAEDHPVNQRVVQLILADRVAEIVTVADGMAALQAFGRSAFDLVLMDMQMPVMDGLAATRAIRALESRRPGCGRTPILMLSANAMPHHLAESAEAGADRHVPKPITAASLLAGIEAVLTVLPEPVAMAG